MVVQRAHFLSLLLRTIFRYYHNKGHFEIVILYASESLYLSENAAKVFFYSKWANVTQVKDAVWLVICLTLNTDQTIFFKSTDSLTKKSRDCKKWFGIGCSLV